MAHHLSGVVGHHLSGSLDFSNQAGRCNERLARTRQAVSLSPFIDEGLADILCLQEDPFRA
jgi:hypothetical protein